MTVATENLETLRASLSRAYPVTEMPGYDDLLTAIDDADEKNGRGQSDRRPSRAETASRSRHREQSYA